MEPIENAEIGYVPLPEQELGAQFVMSKEEAIKYVDFFRRWVIKWMKGKKNENLIPSIQSAMSLIEAAVTHSD